VANYRMEAGSAEIAVGSPLLRASPSDFLCASSPGQCSVVLPLSMAEAIQLALAHNRSIQMTAVDVKRADAEI
jgi:hypothetical protein